MIERVLTFGPNACLVGTLTLPDQKREARPALLLFNSGFIYRVGAHRLNVRLGRLAASLGHPALRFDFSGFGDSGRSSSTGSDQERAAEEIEAAMDKLLSMGVADQFILLGLCSGTDHCLSVARRNSRVAGIILIDPFAYRTWRQRARHIVWRIRNRLARGRFADIVTERISDLRKRLSGKTNRVDRFFDFRTQPPRDEFAAWFQALAGRNTQIFVAYSGDFPHWYNYAEQFWDSLPSLKGLRQITLHYYAEANHTFTALALQEQLLADVDAWLNTAWGGERRLSDADAGNSRPSRNLRNGGVIREATGSK